MTSQRSAVAKKTEPHIIAELRLRLRIEQKRFWNVPKARTMGLAFSGPSKFCL